MDLYHCLVLQGGLSTCPTTRRQLNQRLILLLKNQICEQNCLDKIDYLFVGQLHELHSTLFRKVDDQSTPLTVHLIDCDRWLTQALLRMYIDFLDIWESHLIKELQRLQLHKHVLSLRITRHKFQYIRETYAQSLRISLLSIKLHRRLKEQEQLVKQLEKEMQERKRK